jgi:hypothetical protein
MYPAYSAAAPIILPEPISMTPVFAAIALAGDARCPPGSPNSRSPQPRALGLRLASHRPGTGRSVAGRNPWPGVWSLRVTGRVAPTARASLHLAVYRLRAGDLATAVKRDGQGSNP